MNCVENEYEYIYRDDDGLRHRIGGPAFISKTSGFRSWWRHGKRHRIDGPAVINKNGTVEYWINGSQVRDPERIELIKLAQLGRESENDLESMLGE